MDSQALHTRAPHHDGEAEFVSLDDIFGSTMPRPVTGLRRPGSSRRGTPRQIEELVSANRRKDQLLATVCHELRGPLTSILYAARLLGSAAGDGARGQVQALLERQAGRMTRLIDDLLDVARIGNSRMQLLRRRIDLRIVVNDAIETLTQEIGARRQQLTVVLPEAPVYVEGDSLRLEQVFINLLTNAVKYTPPGGRLEIGMQERTGEAVVRVSDSGIGIAPQMLPQIFELFRQADGLDSSSSSGLGIGLAVVRSLVELHGGAVTAASAGEGRGSEFTVCLPRGG